MNKPVCAAWPLPPEGTSYYAWNQSVCAFCGGDAEVLDHDHETGLTRGFLCRRCNRMEGIVHEHADGHPLLEAWNAWRAGCNPATILDQQEPYNGWGWIDGVNAVERYYAAEAAAYTDDDLWAALDSLPRYIADDVSGSEFGPPSPQTRKVPHRRVNDDGASRLTRSRP